jgi:crotonobetainyl-CoA:carnitine CoA-transferase CaiB-like acyl-CoA transferase
MQSHEHPRAGKVKVVGPAVGFSDTPAAIDRPAPLVGEHSREVLSEFGITQLDIERALTSGVTSGVAEQSSLDDPA